MPPFFAFRAPGRRGPSPGVQAGQPWPLRRFSSGRPVRVPGLARAGAVPRGTGSHYAHLGAAALGPQEELKRARALRGSRLDVHTELPIVCVQRSRLDVHTELPIVCVCGSPFGAQKKSLLGPPAADKATYQT